MMDGQRTESVGDTILACLGNFPQLGFDMQFPVGLELGLSSSLKMTFDLTYNAAWEPYNQPFDLSRFRLDTCYWDYLEYWSLTALGEDQCQMLM